MKVKSKNAFFKVLPSIVLIILFIILIRVFLVAPAGAEKLTVISDTEYDPAVWGKIYPLEYNSYLKNKEMAVSPTGFGGSIKLQKSIRQPEMLMNFKGNAFSKDYSEDRGHPYSMDDLKESKRVTPKTPGSCMTCKTPNLRDVYKDMGWNYAKTPLAELLSRIKHPISCANCHDPQGMQLRVSNPAFIEAMGKRGIDVAKAPRQDMRSYVCGQCHSEYYLEPKTSRVIFPWDKGLKPQEIYAYYKDVPSGFEMDWQHPDSQAKMLKAQHPDFELASNGFHSKFGLACANCHMPFMLEGGVKYSSHWVTSPLKHIQASCSTCHQQDEQLILERVKTKQNNVFQLLHTAGQTIARAHEVLGKAGAAPKVNKADLDKARELLRNAQWLWDFFAAENSMGFHNTDEAQNTLKQSNDLAQQAIAMASKAAGTQN
ncbi:MAG TPA: ammonia-forming cytochrome c nitrite reductase subunit c552 [Smithellaceae bacterium]|nr:ammonia-forming cytochrome c nitrite reductase subunit c552 [Smithellaceae bacterium]